MNRVNPAAGSTIQVAGCFCCLIKQPATICCELYDVFMIFFLINFIIRYLQNLEQLNETAANDWICPNIISGSTQIDSSDCEINV